MANPGQLLSRWKSWMMRAVVAIGFVVGVVVLLLWLAGKFTPKVPAVVVEGMGHEAPTNGQVVTVRLVTRPLYEQAVGSIRAVHETSVGSKILARVVEVDLKAGQKVTQGQVLVRLDDSDLKAKFQQAQAAIAAAEARRAQAALDEQRLAQLLKSHAANQHEYDTAATKLRSADADLRQAQETANEVQAMLDYATVRATMDGVVVDKKIDVGDMVTPGQVLLTLFDPTRMQLVASVRESLAHRLAVGQTIGVQVDVLDKLCSGTVSEVVPEAQSASRSFQVKVTGPCPAGIYSGMFGRILIPLQEEQLLVIPREAVRNIGQLQMVDVVQEGQVQRRAIRTGRELEDGLEVLSGLRAGEQVLVPADGLRGQEADHG